MSYDHPIVAFSLASLAVAISPGPSWFYVISITLEQGRRRGFVAVLGNGAGIFCHVMAAALGISAMLSWSLTAFIALKWLGACYLIYLGVRMLRHQQTPNTTVPPESARSIFGKGILVNLLNPKVALLMLALLPQFVDPSQGNTALKTACIGAIHVLIASLVLSCIVIAVGRGIPMFARSKKLVRFVRYVSGSLLICFGVRLAMSVNR